MPTLKFISGVYDADMQKYVSGVEYDGEGLVRFHAAPPSTDVGRSMANEEQMRRNLSGTPTPVNTFTIGGVVFGGPGISDGDRITIAVTSPDGSTSDDISYIYALGDTVADLLAKIQEAFDDAEDGAVTVSLVDGVITITDTVGLTDSETALVLTFVDTTPNETAWTLPTFTEDTAGVTAVAAVAQVLTAPAALTLEAGGNAIAASLLADLAQSGDALDGGAGEIITINGDDAAGDPIAQGSVRVDSGNTVQTLLTAIQTFFGGGTAAINAGVITYTAPAGASDRSLTLAFADTEVTGTTTLDAMPLAFDETTAGVAAVTEVPNVVTGAPALLVATDPAELNTALQDLDAVIGILDPAA